MSMSEAFGWSSPKALFAARGLPSKARSSASLYCACKHETLSLASMTSCCAASSNSPMSSRTSRPSCPIHSSVSYPSLSSLVSPVVMSHPWGDASNTANNSLSGANSSRSLEATNCAAALTRCKKHSGSDSLAFCMASHASRCSAASHRWVCLSCNALSASICPCNSRICSNRSATRRSALSISTVAFLLYSSSLRIWNPRDCGVFPPAVRSCSPVSFFRNSAL